MTPKMTTFHARNGFLSTRNFGYLPPLHRPLPRNTTILHLRNQVGLTRWLFKLKQSRKIFTILLLIQARRPTLLLTQNILQADC
jgi:hypothetical protein